MADEKLVAILKQDVDSWNLQRREEDHEAWCQDGREKRRVDLRGANLRGANLSGALLEMADLRDADLQDANLRKVKFGEADLRHAKFLGADISKADLTEANLSAAFLRRANLSGARLNLANLWHADLVGANLDRANLAGANLALADLSEANLTEAHFRTTVLANTLLTGVKGLDAVDHGGPSSLDLMTLERSEPLPLVFLRGCGLQEALIKLLPSLLSREFYSCFISYSSKDQDFVSRLHADLQDKGVQCWFAPEDMKTGDKIRSRIDETIRVHDKLLLILSEHSVASKWVEKEVEAAFDKEPPPALFPIRLDNAVMETGEAWAADVRRTRHIGDFTNWKDHDAYQAAFERLLRDLKKEENYGDMHRLRT